MLQKIPKIFRPDVLKEDGGEKSKRLLTEYAHDRHQKILFIAKNSLPWRIVLTSKTIDVKTS